MNYSRSEFISAQAAERTTTQSPPVVLPRVSVIVTCFNYARYVSQALDSVFAQTYQNFDCVIVDDASSDESAQRIERWLEDHKDPRFRFIRSSVNRGQTASFAVGLAATSGEFVAFLDADDYWFPRFLQTHVEAHLNRAYFASLSCSDLVQIDEERRMLCGTLAGPVLEETQTTISAQQLTRVTPSNGSLEFSDAIDVRYIAPVYSEHLRTATSGIVFRRSALDLIMPENPDELRVCTDWYMYVICHYFTGSLFISSALGAYRRHGNNNFASNPILGYHLHSGPSAALRHHKVVVGVMLRHLVDHFDRLAGVFSADEVRRLVRVLFTKALREQIPIEDESRLRNVLGPRGTFEAKARAKLTFLARLRAPIRSAFFWR